jgi:hypothetical protein
VSAYGGGRLGAVRDQGAADVTDAGALTNQRTHSSVTSGGLPDIFVVVVSEILN